MNLLTSLICSWYLRPSRHITVSLCFGRPSLKLSGLFNRKQRPHDVRIVLKLFKLLSINDNGRPLFQLLRLAEFALQEPHYQIRHVRFHSYIL
ncbi:hypothetical protein D3C73_1167010 [compost metagenome]